MTLKSRAETSRENGKLSRGAITERGRAIASTNATKHGILSTKPPLLISEDVEVFNSILEGLTQDYQPTSTIEQLLIDQLAVGYLRLHRLWAVESSLSNIQMLRKKSDLANSNFDGDFFDPQNNSLFDKISVEKQAFLDSDQMDRLLRYERHITRLNNDTLDRLQSIQQRSYDG